MCELNVIMSMFSTRYVLVIVYALSDLIPDIFSTFRLLRRISKLRLEKFPAEATQFKSESKEKVLLDQRDQSNLW